jgi:hypothetical protein
MIYTPDKIYTSPAYLGRYCRIIHARQDPGIPQRYKDPLDASDCVGEDLQRTGDPSTWERDKNGELKGGAWFVRSAVVCKVQSAIVCEVLSYAKCYRVQSAIACKVLSCAKCYRVRSLSCASAVVYEV